jgi:hypothetical protein
MPTVNGLLDIVKAELANLLPEEVFRGYRWNRIF